MEREESNNRKMNILVRIGGALFLPPEELDVLPMGPEYTAEMKRLQTIRSSMFGKIKKDLAEVPVEKLAQDFQPDGYPISDEATALVARFRGEIRSAFDRLKPWYMATLFRTDQLADFDHWGRSEFLSVDEIVWLSVGLEPSADLASRINPNDKYGKTQKLGKVETYMSRHKEIIRRKFDPHNFGDKPRYQDLHTWIKEVSLDVHPEFLRIIDKERMAGETKTELSGEVTCGPDLDSREKNSMLKLIVAMAIDGYRFDPNARRSEIPNEIKNAADRLGLELSSNTIRKYLKQGGELLPADWDFH